MNFVSVTGKDASWYTEEGMTTREAKLKSCKCFYKDCIEPEPPEVPPPPKSR